LTEYAVVAAVICRDGRAHAAQRSYPPALAGLWEFPGGKVEPGETASGALIRECQEELSVQIAPGDRIGPDVVTTDGRGRLHAYLASLPGAEEPSAAEHRRLCWLSADELGDVDWLPADQPIVSAVAEHLRVASTSETAIRG
jgi:8-oxo-dGTP diphosphatase